MFDEREDTEQWLAAEHRDYYNDLINNFEEHEKDQESTSDVQVTKKRKMDGYYLTDDYTWKKRPAPTKVEPGTTQQPKRPKRDDPIQPQAGVKEHGGGSASSQPGAETIQTGDVRTKKGADFDLFNFAEEQTVIIQYPAIRIKKELKQDSVTRLLPAGADDTVTPADSKADGTVRLMAPGLEIVKEKLTELMIDSVTVKNPELGKDSNWEHANFLGTVTNITLADINARQIMSGTADTSAITMNTTPIEGVMYTNNNGAALGAIGSLPINRDLVGKYCDKVAIEYLAKEYLEYEIEEYKIRMEDFKMNEIAATGVIVHEKLGDVIDRVDMQATPVRLLPYSKTQH